MTHPNNVVTAMKDARHAQGLPAAPMTPPSLAFKKNQMAAADGHRSLRPVSRHALDPTTPPFKPITAVAPTASKPENSAITKASMSGFRHPASDAIARLEALGQPLENSMHAPKESATRSVTSPWLTKSMTPAFEARLHRHGIKFSQPSELNLAGGFKPRDSDEAYGSLDLFEQSINTFDLQSKVNGYGIGGTQKMEEPSKPVATNSDKTPGMAIVKTVKSSATEEGKTKSAIHSASASDVLVLFRLWN